MKPNESTNEPLDQALREWKVTAALPPRFQEEVWRRIALSEVRSRVSWWADLRHSIEAAFRRPALAISYLAILLLVGLSAGLTQARQASARMDQTLESRYLHSVDPYLARGR